MRGKRAKKLRTVERPNPGRKHGGESTAEKKAEKKAERKERK